MSLEDRRLSLQATLEAIPGIKKVYYQPPASIHLQYPCIIYSLDDDDKVYANGSPYLNRVKFSILVITKDPLPEEMMSVLNSLPYVSFSRHYTSDNLHHYSYTTSSFERY